MCVCVICFSCICGCIFCITLQWSCICLQYYDVRECVLVKDDKTKQPVLEELTLKTYRASSQWHAEIESSVEHASPKPKDDGRYFTVIDEIVHVTIRYIT